jgi:LuxR family quorum sensing-dependent transcriptional regulator
LDDTLEFVRDVARATTPHDVCVTLLEKVEEYGIQHIIGSTVPPIGASKSEQEEHHILRHYPAEWLDRYMSRGYLAIDPLVKRLKAEMSPFAWSEVASLCRHDPEAQRIMDERAEFGLKSGITVPLPLFGGGLAGFSLSGERVEVPRHKRETFSLIATSALVCTALLQDNAAPTTIALTDREREALRWAAEGKSEWEIGVILGVSEHTAEKFLRSARVKLGASNRTHAVAEAIRLKLID